MRTLHLILVLAAMSLGTGATWGQTLGTEGPAAGAQSIRMEGAAAGHALGKAAAEAFAKSHPGASPIALGISGDAGGLAKFCRGEIDVVNTSRPIQKEELAACAKLKTAFIELPIAFDAVTLIVNPRNRFVESLSVEQLRRLWEAGAQGRLTKWSQLNPDWPDAPLKLVGPDRISDESRYFAEAVLGPGRRLRQDYMASTEDAIIVEAVARDPNALGYVPYAYYATNRARLRAVPIIGPSGTPVAPSPEAVAQGLYQPLSRPLFLYASVRSLEKAGVREFLEFYLGHAARLAKLAHYVPLAESTYQLGLTRLRNRLAGTAWDGGVPVGLTLEALHKRQTAL